MFRLLTNSKSDFAAVSALLAELNPSDPPICSELGFRHWLEILKHPMTFYCGIEQDGMLVSCCALTIVPNLTRSFRPYGLIENVVTTRAQRGKGYGRFLLQEAQQLAWSRGCYKVMLLTGSRQAATLRFYEKCGFTTEKTGFTARPPLS